MTSTELAIAEFPRILERYSSRASGNELETSSLKLKNLERIDIGVPYDDISVQKFLNNRPDVRKGLEGVIKNCLSVSLSSKFPLISDELFQLKRYLTFYKDSGKWQLVRDTLEKPTTPLFSIILPKNPFKPLKPKEPIYSHWDYPLKKVEEIIRNGWIQIKFVKDEDKYNKEIKIYKAKLQKYNEESSKYTQDKRFYDGQKEKKEILEKNTSLWQIPLFVYTPLFEGEPQVKLGEFLDSSRIERRDGWEKKHNRKICIGAKLPGILGIDVRQAYRGALSHYFGILSAMFENPVAGDIIYQQKEILNPKIGAIWIPTPESLGISTKDELVYRKEIDPAMILRVAEKSYLVKTWNVENEEPFEQYLKMYSGVDRK
ncbi:MAG: hypothetical protein KKF67_03580 [Nanoarchaeota archaeon]|nr:hypothetical protein [Nanoarchaeota archaeon]